MNGKKFKKDKNGATILENGQIYRIPATKDYMFKNLFGINGKEENLKGLLEAILKINIKSLVIQNPEIPPKYKDDKKSVLDIKAKLNDGTSLFVEMQVKNEHNIGERAAFYLCTVYSNTIKSGKKYNEIEKVIAIIITNFSYFNRREYHQIAHLKFEECEDINEIVEEIMQGEDQIVTDTLELHIIDLKRFKSLKNPKGDLADYLNLIIGNEEAIEMATQRNKTIKVIDKENRNLSMDEKMQEEYWYELKAELARNTELSVARNEGMKLGEERGLKLGEERGLKLGEERGLKLGEERGLKLGEERGLKLGEERGLKLGEERGLKLGKERGKIEIAKKLLEMGMKIEQIKEATGLTEEDIKKLKN